MCWRCCQQRLTGHHGTVIPVWRNVQAVTSLRAPTHLSKPICRSDVNNIPVSACVHDHECTSQLPYEFKIQAEFVRIFLYLDACDDNKLLLPNPCNEHFPSDGGTNLNKQASPNDSQR